MAPVQRLALQKQHGLLVVNLIVGGAVRPDAQHGEVGEAIRDGNGFFAKTIVLEAEGAKRGTPAVRLGGLQ